MPTNTTQKEKIVKHRACDECRTRKLACSKDSSGCERCKREAITCHYSEQKQMGRPRKRQFIEMAQDGHVSDPTVESLDLGPLPFNLDYNYNYSDSAITEPYYTSQPTLMDDGGNLWNVRDGQILDTTPINFEDLGIESVNNIDSLVEPPSLLAGSTGSSCYDISSPHNQQPSVPCSCLASMYLALASLQQLPTDIVSALRTVRGAAITASTTLQCGRCGSPAIGQKTPAIDGFQNTMLLGTLIPIIVHGYHRLLKMIDDEADAAVATGRTKTFEFQEYGGLCPNQTSIEVEMACIEKEMMFDAVEMPPMQWKHTVKTLLRLDVYGHTNTHKGLNGLVEEIELRQRKRHTWLDGLPDAERAEIGPGFVRPKHCHLEREQTYACLQVLEIAKNALGNLDLA